MSLSETLSTYLVRIQEDLLPWLDDPMDSPLSGTSHAIRQRAGRRADRGVPAILARLAGAPAL